MKTKFIIVTGGVLSGLGKGVVVASIGKLISKKLNIITIKCDGYLNVDPGTMNPIEHGEVFVLSDGTEVDLDFGHYERFLGIRCKKDWSITSGRVFLSLMEKERRGEFLGKTVQVVPHVTREIRETIKATVKREKADVVMIEVGGTVGDMENLWFLEAAREMINDVGRENILFAHLGLIPVIDAQGQQKTKPLQNSVNDLRERGIFPDIIIGRSKELLTKDVKEKLGLRGNVGINSVFSDPDCESVYELPLIFKKEGMKKILRKKLGITKFNCLTRWKKLVENKGKRVVTIAICGKYTDLADSYISITESLKHCGANLNVKVIWEWIETSKVKNLRDAEKKLSGIEGLIVPGGFGSRGIEGKIKIIQYARENEIPFLGICYGLQLAVTEFSRNVCLMKGANSTEVNSKTKFPVVDILPEQKDVVNKGGTMRLGAYPANLKKGSVMAEVYGSLKASERHRHRYEVNPEYQGILEKYGLVISGKSPDGRLAEFIELPEHKCFIATQGHPELKSRLDKPAPMFMKLVLSCLD